MTAVSALVESTTYQITPPETRLSPTLWSAFSLLNRIHATWRWYRRFELYTNPNNFSQLLAGHIVNFTLGDIVVLRVAAQCLLISTRVLECVQQQSAVYAAGKKWLSSLRDDYPSPCTKDWKIENSTPWQRYGVPIWKKVHRVAMRTVELMKEFFTLSMRIMDAMDAFCLSPYTRNEGIGEGFVNMMKWLDAAVDNKEELLIGLKQNRAIIERILIRSPFTYDQLCSGVETALHRTEVVAVQARRISSIGNGVLVKVGKRSLNTPLIIIGFNNLKQLFTKKK